MRLLIIIIHTATHLWNYMAGIMARRGCWKYQLFSGQTIWEMKEYFK